MAAVHLQAIEFSIVLLVVQEEARGRMVHPECFRLEPVDCRALILLDDDLLVRVDGTNQRLRWQNVALVD